MKKILMLGPVPPPTGGIASVMQDIIHSELASEFDFELFPRLDLPQEILGSVGRNVFRFRRFLRFYRKVQEHDYFLVHIHSPDEAFVGSVAFMFLTRLARSKALLHMHGTDWDEFYTKKSFIRKMFTKYGLYLADQIVALYSQWVVNVRQLCPTAKVQVLRNLVHRQDPPEPAAVQGLREELGLGAKNFVVLTVGYVGWRKGSFEILKAVPQIVSKDDSIRFVFVGSEENPGEMAQLMDQVERQGLQRWVTFTGEVVREKVSLFYGLADIYLLPSFIEGMPISIIEALRSALPVISTRIAGIPDMIEDGMSGLLIEPGAPEAIAQAVLALKSDPDLCKRLAAGAKRTFEEKFEFSGGIEEVRKLYRSFDDH
jgi:glycosyltransferase involved in cell wall biosynthesis